MITVPTLLSTEGVEAKESVPKAWWNHVKISQRVVKSVKQQHGQRPGVTDVVRRSGPRTIQGYNKKQVVVEVDPEKSKRIPAEPDAPNGPIPNEMSGVKIKTAEAPDLTQRGCRCVGYFNNVPGGTGVFSDYARNKGTCISMKYNGSKKLLTAGHVAGCSSDNFFSDPNENNRIGPTETVNSRLDFAIIEDGNRRYVDDAIRYPSGNRIPLKGWVSSQGVETFDENGTQMKSVGAESGFNTNGIKNYYRSPNLSCSNHNRGVDVHIDGGDGDSGGPIFHTNNDKAFLLAIHQYGYNGIAGRYGCTGQPITNWSGGAAAWYVQNNTPINFDIA